MFVLAILGAVACDREVADVQSVPTVEKFDAAMTSDYSYGYQNDHLEFEYFYNEEYAYWGGFAQSRVKDADDANGLFANQYAVYNEAAASGESFLVYYYDSYNEPCEIVVKQQGVSLYDVMLNLTTYTYASITDEAINDFARAFTDSDYLKVVFTAMKGSEVTGSVECYVVDYRDGKRAMTTEWTQFSLANLGEGYDRVRVTIETTDVGEWGANTPLYIAMDNLSYLVK